MHLKPSTDHTISTRNPAFLPCMWFIQGLTTVVIVTSDANICTLSVLYPPIDCNHVIKIMKLGMDKVQTLISMVYLMFIYYCCQSPNLWSHFVQLDLIARSEDAIQFQTVASTKLQIFFYLSRLNSISFI